MNLQRWLERWDRHNQAVMDGVIPDAVREKWKWKRGLDENGREKLSRQRVELTANGVESRFIRTRSWPWASVAYVTWEVNRHKCALAVCIYGDPYVKELDLMTRDHKACRALLDDCRSFVEAHGARVRNTTDPAASMWWANEPEAKRKR